MAGLTQMPLWAKTDDKDKWEAEPNGAFYLNGHLEIGPAGLYLPPGTKLGVSIRRNRSKQKENQPDYYGELYAMTERTEGGR
jgi:hypothetical protein